MQRVPYNSLNYTLFVRALGDPGFIFENLGSFRVQ